MSGNLFELRRDWPVPPTNNTVTATNPKLPTKIEPQEQDQPTPSATAPKPEQCRWGPNCPICKNAEEDWDGETQNMRQIQAQNPQHTQDYQVPQNRQCTQIQSFNVQGRYAEQIHLRREWKEKMEKLNEKYGLDYFSDSELDSELDEGKNYRYEHKYKALI